MTTNLFAFGLGAQEIILILLVLLLLFGAKKLPELARGMGKSLGEFKKAKDEFEDEILADKKEITKFAKSTKKLAESETENQN